MLLTVQNPFKASNPRDTHRMLTPFTNNFSSYQSYIKSLQANTKKLQQQFPHREACQLKLLLQQLQNDYQLTIQLISQQQQASSPLQIQPQPLAMLHSTCLESTLSQNKRIKQIFLKLHYKYQSLLESIDQQQQLIHNNTTALKKLKTINFNLLKEELNQEIEELNNFEIC